MEKESEKRGRNVVARRQQQQYSQSPMMTPSTPSKKSKRKVSDFMLGVAAGLSARKNMPGGLGQATASSGAVLPKHLDFSYRDRSDVTAKRRFQVKIPCRLMVILALVFLIFPGLIFLHRELHIDDEYRAHFKTEKYVNVNTKEVWDNFRLVTNNSEIVQQGVGGNGTTSNNGIQTQDDHVGNVVSDLKNHTVTMSAVAKNQTSDTPATVDEHHAHVYHNNNSAHDHGSSIEGNSASYHDGDNAALSTTNAVQLSQSDTIEVESSKNMNNNSTNSTDTSNISSG